MAKQKSVLDATNTSSAYGRNINVMEKQKEISDANNNPTITIDYDGEVKDITKIYGQVSNAGALYEGGTVNITSSNGQSSHYDFDGITNDKTKMLNIINSLEEEHTQLLKDFAVLDYYWEGEVSYKGITSFIELSYYFEYTILQSLKSMAQNYGKAEQIMRGSENANVSLLSKDFK